MLSKFYEYKIEFFDVDSMDVMWHGNYIRYLESVRCAMLDDIGCGIVFGALAAVPHSVQRHFGTVGSGKYQLLGNYSVAAACTGEAGSL